MLRTQKYPPFIVRSEVLSHDTVDGIVEESCVLGVEEAGPEAKDVICVFLGQAAMAGSRAVVVIFSMVMVLVIVREGRADNHEQR